MLGKVSKIVSILAILIGLVSFYYVYKMADLGDDAMKLAENQASYLDPLYWGTIWILAIAGIFTVGFALVQMLTDVKKLISFAIVAILFAVVYFISAGMATDEIITMAGGKVSTAAESEWTDIGLWSFYIFFAAAAISVITGPIFKLVRS